jgi:hypothetical protein
VLSIAAGIRSADLSRWLGGYDAIVRTMPNTPALIGMGVTGMVATAGVSETQRAAADKVLRAVGQTVWLDDEALIDPVTAVSGSGPAYVFYFMEAMQAGGKRDGAERGAGQRSWRWRPSRARRNWRRNRASRSTCCAVSDARGQSPAPRPHRAFLCSARKPTALARKAARSRDAMSLPISRIAANRPAMPPTSMEERARFLLHFEPVPGACAASTTVDQHAQHDADCGADADRRIFLDVDVGRLGGGLHPWRS